jgi:hypothetical protein
VTVILNGFQYTFEMKIGRPPELKEYKIVVGGGFIGMLGSVVLVKKSTDTQLMKLITENCNMGITSISDLHLLEQITNPKKNKRTMMMEVGLVISPLATLTRISDDDGTMARSDTEIIDMVNIKRSIVFSGDTFCWFKSAQCIDVDSWGGYNAFIMLLSIISNRI